jgi:hypothetical protein
VLRRRR